MTPLLMNMLLTGQCAIAAPHSVSRATSRSERWMACAKSALRTERPGAIVDVEVVAGLGEVLRDSGDLAAVLREVRLPGGAVVVGQCGRFAQQVCCAGDREAGREGVAQAAIRGAVPALAQLG